MHSAYQLPQPFYQFPPLWNQQYCMPTNPYQHFGKQASNISMPMHMQQTQPNNIKNVEFIIVIHMVHVFTRNSSVEMKDQDIVMMPHSLVEWVGVPRMFMEYIQQIQIKHNQTPDDGGW